MSQWSPDSTKGRLWEESIYFEDQETDPSDDHVFQRNGNILKYHDSIAVRTILDTERHRTERQLTHDQIDENHWSSLTYDSNKIASLIIWADALKTQKIREYSYEYSGNKMTKETQITYDNLGNTIETLVFTYSYTGNNIVGWTCTHS